MPRERLPVGTTGQVAIRNIGPRKYVATARIRDTDGKVRQVKATSTTKGKAEQKLRNNIAARIPPTSGNLTGNTTVAEAAAKWIEGYRGATGTLTQYKRSVSKHIAPQIGAYRITELSASRVKTFINAVSAQSGEASARQARNVLRQVMDMCVGDDLIRSNPVAATKPPKPKKTDFTALTGSEIQAIRDHIISWGQEKTMGPRRRADLLLDFLDVLAGTGARPGEVLALRWGDVDFTQETVTISGTIVRADGKLMRQDKPKSESSKRSVKLSPVTVQVLRLRRAREATLDRTAPVFASRVGRWIEPQNMQRIWTSARAGGFETVTFRDYRKAVATLLKKVLGVEAAAEQLGHSSSQITSRYYVEKAGMVDYSAVLDWSKSS